MISLVCKSCSATLQIDDAFVGGVCRCQHCGAIQTVPSDLKKGATEKKVKSQKTLYRKSIREEGVPSSGLDQLAQVVTSSGLSSGHLQEIEGPRKRKEGRGLWIGGAVAAGLVGAMLGVWIMMAARPEAGSARAVSAAPVVPAHELQTPGPPPRPEFLGVPIDEPVVIYVLDRGSGTGELFSHLRAAALKSAGTLGSGRKFQIIFWNNNSGPEAAYPLSGPTYANASNVATAKSSLDGVFAFGQTDVGPALTKAVSASPQVILLATGQGAQLDDSFTEQVMRIVGGKSIKVHTFDLNASRISPAMEAIAKRTGGEARVISEAELRLMARD
jgi:hypothetical protein